MSSNPRSGDERSPASPQVNSNEDFDNVDAVTGTAIYRTEDGGTGGGSSAGVVRRRLPPAPRVAPSAGAHTHYGTYEGDTLLRYAPSPYYDDDAAAMNASDERSLHSSYSSAALSGRRRQSAAATAPWYRHPQKIFLAATLAWVGGVMYLASLAHAILRTQTSIVQSNNMMGATLVNQPAGVGAADGAGDATQVLTSALSGNDNVNVRFGSTDYNDWKKYQSISWEDRKRDKNAKGQRLSNDDAEFAEWLKYQSAQRDGDGEWQQLQRREANVRYDANGMYGNEADLPVAEESPAQAMGVTSSLSGSRGAASSSSGSKASNVATSVSSNTSSSSSKNFVTEGPVSTIDWPRRKQTPSGQREHSLTTSQHSSCTSLNGCTPSANVTVLVVYGPEYHSHISEMAWSVASGVHSSLKRHISHHPNSPIHGHIVFGHTSNLTFLDVMDADAVLIGSPVYNGNVHPDVQNWINYWHIDADLSNKFGGAFVTAGGIHAGADGTLMSLLRSMMVFQMMAVGGDSWTSPFGASATMYEDPFGDTQRSDIFSESCYFTEKQGRSSTHLVHPYFLQKAVGLGERMGNVTVAWKNSSYIRW